MVWARRKYHDEGWPTTVLVEGIEYQGTRKAGINKQRAFKPDELKRLFEGDEIRAFAADGNLHHQYWILLIGLFTGARVNEICQINPQVDILFNDEVGVWFFNISSETEGDERIEKSVKSKVSRVVPLHQKLIELGFLDYFSKVKKEGHKLLFPKWKPSKQKASPAARKWVSDFFTKAGIRSTETSARITGMHAFRSTLLTYGLRTL